MNRKFQPKSRGDFKKHVLSKLGEPVLEVNVTDFQLEQCIDQALDYFRAYHYNGSEHTYYIHKLTQTDIDNRFITLPPEIFSVITIYDASTSTGLGLTSNLYSGAWAVNYDMIYNSVGLTGNFSSYYISQQYFNTLSQTLVAMPSIRFNMHNNILYIDNDWKKYKVDDMIVADCYKEIDADKFPSVWSERFLLLLTTAYVKKQWAENISKYTGTLPGGMQLNWQQLLSDAQSEIQKLEYDNIGDYSRPVFDMIG